jgi:FtsH-binding integral membrane protein
MITVLAILGLVVVMSCCCRHAAQKTPMNILCLLVVTILESVGLGILMNVWEVQTVLMALCLVVVVLCVLLCYYTFFTAGSFDTAGPYLIAVWAVVGAWPPIMFFLTDGQIPKRAAVGIMVLLFCLHVICDLQRMVRKAYRGHDFAPTEHIFAVVSIYLDVVTPTSPICD